MVKMEWNYKCDCEIHPMQQAQPQKRVQHNNAQRRDTETTEASPVTDTPKWIEEVVQVRPSTLNVWIDCLN